MPDDPVPLPPAPGALPDLPLLDRLALVMAHPDDEVLWASSVLARAEAIVLAFGAVPSRPRMAEGRRRAMAAFPLPGAVHLDMAEADVLNEAGWPEPAETPEGLGILRPGPAARYRENHRTLVERLAPLLAGRANVITHAPWGEYGHEEHVQVFRAVLALQPRCGFTLWVPGYCSNVSGALMRRHLGRLGEPTPSLPTDPALGDRLRALYREHRVWTWFDDYVWPDRELFYPYRADLPPGPPPPGRVFPMNHIWRRELPVGPLRVALRVLPGGMIEPAGRIVRRLRALRRPGGG